MSLKSKESQKRSIKEIFRRKENHCERCSRKIKMGRYCYWCGKRLGLW